MPRWIPVELGLDAVPEAGQLGVRVCTATDDLHDGGRPLLDEPRLVRHELQAALAGPMAKLLASLPPEAAKELRDRLEHAAQPYVTARGLEFPGVALVAGATRTA